MSGKPQSGNGVFQGRVTEEQFKRITEERKRFLKGLHEVLPDMVEKIRMDNNVESYDSLCISMLAYVTQWLKQTFKTEEAQMQQFRLFINAFAVMNGYEVEHEFIDDQPPEERAH